MVGSRLSSPGGLVYGLEFPKPGVVVVVTLPGVLDRANALENKWAKVVLER